MPLLIINQDHVRQLLPMDEAISIMAKAFKALGRGEAINPLRQVTPLPEGKGVLVAMPAHLGAMEAMGLKVISVLPGNEGTEYDSHQGAVLLFETEHGSLRAIVDASAITAIRTAAVSGLATQLLAREDATELTILGSGVQAQAHLASMRLARKIRRARVWSRTRVHAERFADAGSLRHGIPVEAVGSAEDAVRGAEIICTTTASEEPVLRGKWLSPGVHINAVGSSVPFARELDTDAVLRSRLFVDRRESTVNESGEFLIPLREGALDASHIQGELGEVLLGQNQGRESPEEITLFKSLGLAVQDLAAAHYVYQRALEKGVGTGVELGGRRHTSP
ncbi:ornithine cyclodeaminase family protein [Chloroflexota bacterium]